MSITLTYTFASIEELQAHLAGKHATPAVVKTDFTDNTSPVLVAAGATCNAHTAATTAKKSDAPTASSPSGAKPPADEVKPAAQEKATAPAADAGEPGKSYTVDDAKALTMKIVADKGRDAAVALLKKYDVPVAAKLPAEKIAAFCREAEGVLL